MMVVLYEELQDEKLKTRFNQLIDSMNSINSNSSEAEIVALNERVCREVTAKPILARIIRGDLWSLLWFACAIRDELFHPTIKCLIEINPSALLWEIHINRVGNLSCAMSLHPTHCVLMPWIAANYQWVLDHERCLEHPPVFYLVHQYVFRGSNPTECTAAMIQQFFEAYPQGLTQSNEAGHTPLHAILLGSAECEPDFIKWMAEQCPDNILKKDRVGCTPLHIACGLLTRNNHSSEICKYLIARCPESVRTTIAQGSELPIHVLLGHCQHRPVKEVVVCLLREYPKSYDIAVTAETRDTLLSPSSIQFANRMDDMSVVPSSIPFIQRIKPLLDEERELKENIVHLKEVSGVFQDAVDGTDNPSPLASSTCEAFSNWATITFVERLEAMLELSLTELQDECDEEEEQDSDHETDEYE